MQKKKILIGLGILVILLALAGTGSAHSIYGGGSFSNCGFCHSSVPQLNANGNFFLSIHKFDGNAEPSSYASCTHCHVDPSTSNFSLISNGSFYSSTHRYNDTTLAAARLSQPACYACHVDAVSNNFNFLTGTPTYLKSTFCENCHKKKYDDWQGTMHRVMLTSNSTAKAMGLPTPPGLSWATMPYAIVGKSELRYLNESGYLFMKYSAENKTFGPYNSSNPGNQPQYSCGRCHTTGYNASGGNQSGLPGIVGTWSEPGIACEKCHGPGGNGHQVEANVSEQVCLQCHNGSTRQGLFLSSAHSPPLKAPVSCLKCHSPFDYARNNTVTSTTAINVVCANCHNSHNTSDDKYRALFSPGGFDQAIYANASDAKNSFFNSTASRLLLTGGPTGTLTAGKDVYDTLTTPALIPSNIIDESYPGPINVTGPISEVLCSNCHYEHGLSHIAGVNLTHARLSYPGGLGPAPATCTDCHMAGNLKSHSFNVKDENNFPSRTCSRGTECHVTSDQNLNHSRFSVVPVVNEWKKSAHNDKEIGVNKSNPNSSFYFSRNATTGIVTIRSRPNSCNKCHSPIDWNPATDSNTTPVQLPADFKGITCAICHNIHDMGDWLKKTGKAYGWYNRDAIPVTNTTGAITRYKANYSMMANTTELCGNCHSNDNPRIYRAGPGWNQTTDTTPISPHGWPAKDIFDGSVKQTVYNFECISCHMATKITDPTNLTEMVLPDSQKVKGHSFSVNVSLLQSNATCAGCHNIGTNLGNLSTTIQKIQADTHEKWNATNITVMNALATVNAFTGPKDQSRDLIARAYWNLQMVSSDNSWGVHNPVKVNNMLNESSTMANDSIAALGLIVTGKPNVTSFSPSTPTVIDVVGGPTRTFSITVDQTVNVSWKINETEVASETGVTTSSYSNDSAAQGTWNVTAFVQNVNGSVMQNWMWMVTPQVAGFTISGFKTNSANNLGVPGWTINLTNATMNVSATTDANGMYQFTGFANGTYMVTEMMEGGWTNVSPMSIEVLIGGANVMNRNFTNALIPVVTQPTSFLLTPDTSVVLKGTTINMKVMALNGNLSLPDFNGTANITIEANNLSAVNAPINVNFTNGNATIDVTSSVAQFVIAKATNGTITGSTTVEFADFVINLVKGWNLVSIPSFANPSDINQTLLLVQNNGVQTFNPDTMLFVTPTDLQPLYGYWINVTADNQKLGFIADTNDIIVPPTRNLFEGWNLIGMSASRTHPDTLNAGMLFVSLKYGNHFTQQYYSELVTYDEQPPKTLVAGENDLTDLTDNTPLKKGHGYWLFIKNIPNTNENNVPWAGKLW